ncbi:hypothetical protein [Deinococcus aluminii]|uniref:Uncharacterized protein n=1 Tax=Deinococcus aluminii TaxID=1656885 RepID=A0ABP9XDF3_9DEIO
MQDTSHTPADGTYSFTSPLSGAPVLARFEDGKLTAYLYAGEAQPLTELAAAQLAHLIGYLDGVAFAPLAQPIGKAAAARLHRIMGRLGIPSAQHYALAAAALGEWKPLESLAELTEREARTVWQHVCSLYPSARTLAA